MIGRSSRSCGRLQIGTPGRLRKGFITGKAPSSSLMDPSMKGVIGEASGMAWVPTVLLTVMFAKGPLN